MKIYTTFKELKSAPKVIQEYYMDMECHEPPIDETQFMYYYGGDVYLIETEKDLKEISTPLWEESVTDRFLNITETPAAFDSCSWLSTGDYVQIYLVTTNTGGPTYFIPKEIANNNLNVLRSIELSNPNQP
jgi:hypothetical protein